MKYTITLTTKSQISVDVDATSEDEALQKASIETLRQVPKSEEEHISINCTQRVCSATGEIMDEGWVVGDGDEYFKYEKDALLYARLSGYEDLSDAYNDEYIYWTQF